LTANHRLKLTECFTGDVIIQLLNEMLACVDLQRWSLSFEQEPNQVVAGCCKW